MIEEKKRLRKEFSLIRNSLPNRDEQSGKIAKRLFETELYKNAKTVFVYVSIGSEVQTDEIIRQAFAEGKRLAVPLCNTEGKTMDAVLVDDISELKVGAYGIPEPTGEKVRVLSEDDIDLVIVPALAFDRQRMRLGYGGGYYDKFLAGYDGASVGLAFSECIEDKLPTAEFDCRVDRVICPEEMI